MRRKTMSWWSDKEPFDEFDDPYCVWKSMANGGKCGQSKEECDRCMKQHAEETKNENDE